MTVEIPPELEAYVRAVSSDSGRSPTEVLTAALRLYREVEQRRQDLRVEIQLGLQSCQGIPADDVLRELYERANAATSAPGE